jgi:hypothetical protein
LEREAAMEVWKKEVLKNDVVLQGVLRFEQDTLAQFRM